LVQVLDDEEVSEADDGEGEEEAEHPDEHVEELHQEETAGNADDVRHGEVEVVGDEVDDSGRVAQQTDHVVRLVPRM